MDRSPAPPVGASLGLEHLVVPVRDLTAATETFRRDLGFSITPGTTHESGTFDNSIIFANEGYIELLGIHDPTSNSAIVAEVREFLSKREGPVTVGVRVADAEVAASFFRARGCELRGPFEVRFPDPDTGALSPPLYSSFEILGQGPYVHDRIFFTQRVETNWQEYHATNAHAAAYLRSQVTVHANTAQRIGAAWLAVNDLEQAAATYTALGLSAGTGRRASEPDATVANVPLGTGSLLLAEPRSREGPCARALAVGGGTGSMMGISVEVASLEKAARQLGSSVRRSERYDGWLGRSFSVPPEETHGTWLEFYEPT